MDRLKRSLKVKDTGNILPGDMGLITYAKCLATCWGIFLLMVMMGYAIVEIPRSFWVSGHPEMHMYYCYRRIPEIEE